MSRKNKPNLPSNISDGRSLNHNGKNVFTMRSFLLPPPDEMEEYEKYCPGITKSFVDTYKEQVEHRIRIEGSAVESGSKRAERGQIFAFILGLVAIVGGFVLIGIDKNSYGIAAIIGAVATLLTSFFGGSIVKSRERIKKAAQNPDPDN